MPCQFRTVGAGLGVVAVCFMLSSLSWQYVLLGFALTSITWALWSAANQLSEPKPEPDKVKPFQQRRRARPRATIYDFRSSDWRNDAQPYS